MNPLQKALAALMAVCALALAGCGNSGSPAMASSVGGAPGSDRTTGRVSVADEGFSIVPPAGWTAAPKIAPAFLVYTMPAQVGFTANFNVVAQPDDGESLDALPAQMKAHMPKFLQSWKLVDEGFVEINGRRAYRVCSQHKMQGVHLKLLQYMLKGDNSKTYTISFTAPVDRFDLVKGIFEQSAGTILLD
jgi:hypothetical protein